ncbi:MAG: AraC family transcriptional regulator [Burkholderiales bacterium]|jgi:AraC-like DNA-binding protein|nr:MAG: AraC family transcriptional regulator [Burkholderiales bacterium]
MTHETAALRKAQGRVSQHQVIAWRSDDIGFQRVVISSEQPLALNRVFHEDITILAFQHCRWRSEQDRKQHDETPEHLIVRDAGRVFSSRLMEVDDHHGGVPECREMHIPVERMAQIHEQSHGVLPAFDFSSPVIHSPDLVRLFWDSHWLFEHRHECTLLASTYLTWLISAVAERTSGQPIKVSDTRCQYRPYRAVEYLRAHFHDKVSLVDLAQVCQTNPYTLLRQFKQAFGMAPHDYLLAYRIFRAKQYLQSGLPCAEVALLCGFSDQSHLSRRFKQRLGVSPGSIVARCTG